METSDFSAFLRKIAVISLFQTVLVCLESKAKDFNINSIISKDLRYAI